jgi:DNA N-6-adenine-methyltransferase (Dam)
MVHHQWKPALSDRIGVDQSSAYQLVKLWQHRAAILARCRDEGRYYGWETCLYWHEKPPRWRHRDRDAKQEYGMPAIFRRFGAHCTLDVCATLGRALCADFIPKAKNGLTQDWHGVVRLNPPYTGIYRVWSDAPWFHDFMPFGKITLLRGKLSYVGRNGYAPFPSMIVEWNPQTMKRRPASRWTSLWTPACASAASTRRDRAISSASNGSH